MFIDCYIILELDNYLHKFCFNDYIRKVLLRFFFLIFQTYNIFLIIKMPQTIEWSKEEMQLLIDLRKNKNEDYWRRFGRSKVPFWDEIAAKIYEDLGTPFTGVQVREKFKGMIKDCKVSKIHVKEIRGVTDIT
jgi:Myb/SANT-like DNA-binding domain